MSLSLNPVDDPSEVTKVLNVTETTAAFIDSVGVNMHSGMADQDIPYRYRDTALVESALQYLDITHIRDGLGAGFSKPGYDYTTTTEKYLAERGYKFDFPISTLAPYEIAALDNFVSAYPGALESLEGPNEANNLTVDQAVAFQNSLFEYVHSDPLLKNIPVMDFTLAYAQPHYFEQYGNLSAISDEGNVHIYGTYGRSPSGLADWLSIAQAATPDRQMNITETGYSTLSSNTQYGVDETTQAKYILDTLMDAAENGVKMTYLYELLDRDTVSTTSPIQSYYGLFRDDGTPKQSAIAIHNLMTIFDTDASTSTDLGSLDVIFAQPLDKNIHTLLVQKNDNTFDLVLWAEPNIWDPNKHQVIQAPTISVDLSFPGATSAVVFDPMLGTAPVSVFDNPESASVVNVSDHPVIIEITLGGTYVDSQSGALTTRVASLAALEQGTPVTAIAVRDTAANLSGALAILGKDARVKSIAVSDGNPLSLTYAQFKSDTAGLNKVASYSLDLNDVSVASLAVEKNVHVKSVSVSDKAAKLSGAELGILGSDTKVRSISVSDGNLITLTNAQYAAASAAFAKFTSSYTLTVSAVSVASMLAIDRDNNVVTASIRDTAATLGGAALGLLGSDSKVQSMAVSDGKPLVLTYAQYQGDVAALRKLVGAYSLTVGGTSVANLAALEQNIHVTQIGVGDTAGNLAGALAALGADSKVKSITVSDGNRLALSYAQFKSGTAGLNKIASYGLTLSSVPIANLSVDKNVHVMSVTVADSAAKLSGTEFGILGADAKVSYIAASDGNPITLTYAQYAAASSAIGKLATGAALVVTGVPVSSLSAIGRDPHVTGITVRDTAVNVASAFDDLKAHASILTSIGFIDKTAPSLTLTITQAEADASLLPKIDSPFALNIKGTDGAMSSSFDAFAKASSTMLYTELFNTDGSHSYDAQGSGLKLTASHNDAFNLSGQNEMVVFGASGFGAAEISNFSAGDLVQFSKAIFASYSQLSMHVSGTGDAVVTDTAGDSLTLTGISVSSLASSMFKFA